MTIPELKPELKFVNCLSISDLLGLPDLMKSVPADMTTKVSTKVPSMAYWQWGSAQSAHVIVCVHGLSRQGRDFDALAQSLVDRANGDVRVVCPDVMGRGQSAWLKDAAGYQVPRYAEHMLVLLQTLNESCPVARLDWVGTSMGALIGMAVAGQARLLLPVPIRRLVINDIGPVLQWQALQRIGAYIGHAERFGSLQEAADAMWAISSEFGPHTPEQWLALCRPMVKPLPDASGYTLHYDPAIAAPFRVMTQDAAQAGEEALWHLYDNINAEVLVTRGAQSDLLSVDTAQRMTQRGPKAKLIEFAGVGHAPTFVADDQRQVLIDWLLRT